MKLYFCNQHQRMSIDNIMWNGMTKHALKETVHLFEIDPHNITSSDCDTCKSLDDPIPLEDVFNRR